MSQDTAFDINQPFVTQEQKFKYWEESKAEIKKLQASNNHLREAFQNSIVALEKANVEGLITDTIWAGDSETLFDYMGEALSATPAESLQAHDDELIEKCAEILEELIEYRSVIDAIRALKEVK